ncbi:replication initiation protein [Endozoicomonas atrinae]|uniref:replication initiation protein n=1 Tax=Endozoicomonas atrinae TaxID=1333660 RepID=UPI003B0002BA
MSIIRDDSAQDQRLVLKGNALVEGRYKLSLIAQKMFIAMVSRVNPTDEKLPGFVLTREELLKMDIGVSKATAYRQFSDACIELLGLRVSVVERNLKTGEVDETDINIFSKNTRTWKDQSRTSLKWSSSDLI